MRLSFLLNTTFLLSLLSLVAAAICPAPTILAPLAIDYTLDPTGFTFEAQSTPECFIYTVSYIDALMGGGGNSHEYNSVDEGGHLHTTVLAPPGDYIVIATVRGLYASQYSKSPEITSQIFSVRAAPPPPPIVCETPVLISPTGGEGYRFDPLKILVTIGNIGCEQVKLVYTKVGGAEGIALLGKTPGLSVIGENVPVPDVGLYDVTIQGVDPSGIRPSSPRSSPVRVTVSSQRCDMPVILTPLEGETFRTFPPSFYAEISSNDCRDINLEVINTATGASMVNYELSRSNGESKVQKRVYLPYGAYTIKARATWADADRTPSEYSVGRNLIVAEKKCTLPTLGSPTAGQAFQLSPTGFNYVMSTTDCRALTITATQVGGSGFVYTNTALLGVGQNTIAASAAAPAGTYQVSIRSGDANRDPSSDTPPVTFTVRGQSCPVPTINHPSQGERFQVGAGESNAVTQYEMTTISPCTSVLLTKTNPDGTIEPYNVAGSTHYSQAGSSGAGTYKVSAVARDPSGGMSESAATPDQTFYVDPPLAACDIASITSPTANQVIPFPDGSLTYTIAYGNCRHLSFYMNGAFMSERDAVAGTTSFSENVSLPPGRYEGYVIAEDTAPADEPRRASSRGPTLVFTVEAVAQKCPIPTINHPAQGERFQIGAGESNGVTQYEVTTTSPCTSISLIKTNPDGTVEPYTRVGSTHYAEAGSSGAGTYKVSAVARDPSGGMSESDATPDQTFYVDPPLAPCDIATLISPTADQIIPFPDGSFTYTVSYGNCRHLSYYLNNAFVVTRDVPADSTIYHEAGRLEPGRYEGYLIAEDVPTTPGGAAPRPSSRGPTLVFYVQAAAQKCPVPIVNHPSQGERFQVQPGETNAITQYEITTTAPCTSIFFTKTNPDGVVEPYNVAGSTHYSQAGFSPAGTYTIRAIASDPSGGMTESEASVDQTFHVDPPLEACDVATITSPTANQIIPFPDGSFTYSISYGNCRHLSFYMNGAFIVARDADAGATSFSENARLDPGRYEGYVIAEDTAPANGPRRAPTQGPTVVFFVEDVNVVCAAPVITSPANTVPPAITGRKPTFSGTTTAQDRCTEVSIHYYVDDGVAERFLVSGPRVDGNTFGIQATEHLTIGTYVAFARSWAPGSNAEGAKSNEVTIVVAEDPPTPTGNIGAIGRRRIHCKKSEDLCPQKDIRGRKFMICVPDLDSNLEQCGSCGGPDCTLMPNVDDVSCVNGKCQVASCLRGFGLILNACEPVQQASLRVQKKARHFRM